MKKALITGGNRGIGLATCKTLSAMGHQVFLGARHLAEGEKAARQCGATAIQLDVKDQHSIQDAIEAVGPLDILINNAGILGSGSVFDRQGQFEDSIAVMVDGPFQLMKRVVPQMVAHGYGRIVNVSSGWGAFSDGLGGPGGYGVAKAALNALTLAAANSLPDYVKVNAACPGWVRTRMGGMLATRSPEKGAETICWLATLDEKGPTGKFFRDKAEIDW